MADTFIRLQQENESLCRKNSRLAVEVERLRKALREIGKCHSRDTGSHNRAVFEIIDMATKAADAAGGE